MLGAGFAQHVPRHQAGQTPIGGDLAGHLPNLFLQKALLLLGRSEARARAEHKAELAVKEREAKQLREEKHALKELAARSEGKLARASHRLSHLSPSCACPTQSSWPYFHKCCSPACQALLLLQGRSKC